MKKEVTLLILLSVFLLPIIFAEKCEVVSESLCVGDYENILMWLSDETNAHAAKVDTEGYNYVLCCDFGEGDTTCNDNRLVSLSADTNAHAEIPHYFDYYEHIRYSNSVCYESLDCVNRTNECNAYELDILSLSADTNAHISEYEDSDYLIKICCVGVCGDGEFYYEGKCVPNSIAYWSDLLNNTKTQYSIITNQTSVRLNYKNSLLPEGTTVNFTIYENRLWPAEDDYIRTFQPQIDSEGSATAEWLITSEDLEKAHNYKEFYFKVFGTNGAITENKESNKMELIIIPPPKNESCESINVCGDYNTSDSCENDDCDVAEEDVENSYDINNELFCDNANRNCRCEWGEGSCSSVWDSIGDNCGNGDPNEEGEECDDGNNNNGDGCSANCEYECGTCKEDFGLGGCPFGTGYCSDGTCAIDCVICMTRVDDPGCLNDGFCGNGVAEGYEECDGNDLKGDSCETLGYENGTLACNSNCTLNKDYCEAGDNDVCGDGVIQKPNSAFFFEQCDGNDFGGINCTELDNYTSGTLECTSRCQFDVRDCVGPNEPECGDGVINQFSEECDRNDFGGRTCFTFGYEGGALQCDKCKLNKNACVGGENVCGDEIVQKPNGAFFFEQCDGNNLTGMTCSDLDNYNFGALSCTGMCYFDVTDCFLDIGNCNHNSTCDVGESCTCDDCNGEQDSCADNLICSIVNTVCCKNETESSSDGHCDIYCATVDPDCDEGVCGDGTLNYEEECDMGDLNSLDGSSGCFDNCNMSSVDPGEDGCPEGTELCADGTCSLNCYYTDERKSPCNNNLVCEDNESCSCEDCNGEQDECASGLLCSFIDSACCNNETNGVCNPYCSYVDPDCVPEESSIVDIGSCLYKENTTDDCEDGVLEYSWLGIWRWATGNEFNQIPDDDNPKDYYYDGTTSTYYYDPTKSYLECRSGSNTIQCPISALLSFFTFINIITILIALGIIYYFLKDKGKKKKKGSRKKRKKRK